MDTGTDEAQPIASGKRPRPQIDTASVAEDAQQKESQRQRVLVEEHFGEEHLTAAAGEVVPDLGQLDDVAPHAPGAAAANKPQAVTSAEDVPDGGEDATGTAPGEQEAAEAADAARDNSSSDAAVFTALEAAEDAFAKQHPEQSATGARSPAVFSQRSASQAEAVDESDRAAARQRLREALAGDPALPASRDAAAQAAVTEAAIADATASRGVYKAALANAVRLAPTVEDVTDLARTAEGRPQGDSAAELAPRADTTGMTGFAVKPRYT